MNKSQRLARVLFSAISQSSAAPTKCGCRVFSTSALRQDPQPFSTSAKQQQAQLQLKLAHQSQLNNLIMEHIYMDGEWLNAHDGKTFAVTDPGTMIEIAHVPDCGAAETMGAVLAARRAYEKWKKVPAKTRGELLRRWREVILENHAELSELITLESGKALKESENEVNYGADFVQLYAEEARRVYGEIIPSPDPSKKILMLKEPVGVSGQITPWNFPAAMVLRKAAPALAAGCSVVIKPAEDTPLAALALARMAEEAGIPDGVINVVTSSRENASTVGKILCESPLVASISFTGSTHVGKILNQLGAGTMKRMSMELGGNGPCLIFNSADIDRAVEGVFAGKFRNGGQACTVINRILVQDEIHDEFVNKFTKKVNTLKVGHGLDEGVTLGPLVNGRNITKIQSLVDDAVSHGATLLLGGGLHRELQGNYYLPTVLTNITDSMQIAHQEIFGPVAAIRRFKTEEEAIRIANDTKYGLSAYVYSENHRQIWRTMESLEAGVVGMNETGIAIAEGTFGGHKESGLGREGGKYGMDDFLEIKYVCQGGF